MPFTVATIHCLSLRYGMGDRLHFVPSSAPSSARNFCDGNSDDSTSHPLVGGLLAATQSLTELSLTLRGMKTERTTISTIPSESMVVQNSAAVPIFTHGRRSSQPNASLCKLNHRGDRSKSKNSLSGRRPQIYQAWSDWCRSHRPCP